MDLREDESVLNFDLQLLHQLPKNNVNVPLTSNVSKDKLRMAISLVKNKTVATDSVIRKYHAARETLYQTQRALYTSMEECKQICIEQRNMLEKCANLEENVRSLQKENCELEQKGVTLENHCEGLMCHINQLQVLVKEYETQIEGFKIENKLDTTSEKDNEKKYQAIKKEKCLLLKDIGLLMNMIVGKKKPGNKEKQLLDKYKTHTKLSIENIDDLFDDALSHSFSDDSVDNLEEVQNDKLETIQMKGANKGKPDIDNVSDSQDIISIDTGRGSSLAYSDSEKCFLSPDYFSTDSPSPEVFESKKVKKIDAATSPLPEVVKVDRAVSPILRQKENVSPNMIDRAVSPCNSTITERPTIITHVVGIDKSTSPLKLTTCDSSTSPDMDILHDNNLIKQVESNIPTIIIDEVVTPLKLIKDDKAPRSFKSCERNISPTNSIRSLSPLSFGHVEANDENDSSDSILMSHEVPNKKDFQDIRTNTRKDPTNVMCKESDIMKILQEKECLELNNSCNVFKQQNKDEEIEQILKEMRLTQELVTPIPKTPAKSYKLKERDTAVVNNHDKSISCPEAALMREENKALHVTVATLVKDVLNIKSILKTHLTDESVKKLDIDNSFQQNTSSNCHVNSEDRFCDISSEVASDDLPPSDLNESENILEDENVANISGTASSNNENSHDETGISDNINYEGDPACNYDFAINEPVNESVKDIVIEKSIDNATEKQKINKKVACKKITKLDKLRKNWMPKQKIKYATPGKVLHLKIMKLSVNNVKEVNAKSSEALNDKNAYEKAVKIMAEFNAQKKTSVTPKAKKISNDAHIAKHKEDKKIIESSKLDVSNEIEDNNCDKKSSRRSTRSRKKHDETEIALSERKENNENETSNIKESVTTNIAERVQQRRGTKRPSIDNPDIERKRSLRSSTVHKSNRVVTVEVTKPVNNEYNQSSPSKLLNSKNACCILDNNNTDIECKTSKVCKMQQCVETSQITEFPQKSNNPHDNALCIMIQKYGLNKIKYSLKKVSDNIIESIVKKIDEGIAKIIEMPATNAKAGMDKLVDEIKKNNVRHFIAGLMKYLHNPARKVELFSKVSCPPAPPMTKPEQVLLYLVTHLRENWPDTDVVYLILDSIEYSLFKLNRSPDFDVVESMAHFYAVLCRYIKAKNRLRIFVMDAMYCIQFKSIPLIKQCMDVWMHILPLSHMGIAKTPLVTCLVYLLHFFKCEDRLNRVQEIRYFLKQKYFYQVTDWNESKILELFKNAILEIRENHDEKKMLRMALILLAKRQGPKWCQNNIIKNMLLPLIEKEDVPSRVKEFCISIIGPLLKPYPVEMRVHCEITMNQIMDILNQNPSTSMQEAIYTSLIYMSKHNPNRVLKALLLWKPNAVSIEMENLLKDFVREKPVKFWKTALSRLPQ